MLHKHFVLRELRSRWGRIYRVVLGRRPDQNTIEIDQWCAEQPGQFYRSIGHEVYYFNEAKTGLLFKLRWH